MTERATATALLDAAEGAFAADGIETASLRAIMREAGADSGAVHYHFGGREEMARAVLDRVLAPLNRHRRELLQDARQRPDPVPLSVLVDALIRPDLEAASRLDARSGGGGRLIGSIYLRPSAFVQSIVESHFAPVAQDFMPHMAIALPELDTDEISWRVRWCVFGLLGAYLYDDQEPVTGDATPAARRLAAVMAASLQAPPTHTPQEKP